MIFKQLEVGRILLLIIIAISVVSCGYEKKLNNQEPYKKAIGKRFILLEDCYVFKFRSIKNCEYIGSSKFIKYQFADMGYDSESNRGLKNSRISIIDVLKKGSILEVSKVFKNRFSTAGMVEFCVREISLDKNKENNYEEYNLGPGMINTNSITGKGLGDPPIFEIGIAIPVEAEGLWWK